MLSADTMMAWLQRHDVVVGWMAKQVKQWLGHAVTQAFDGGNDIRHQMLWNFAAGQGLELADISKPLLI